VPIVLDASLQQEAEAEVARVSAQAIAEAAAKKQADEDKKRLATEKIKEAREKKAQLALERLSKAQDADKSCNILEAANRTCVHPFIVDKSDKGYFNWYLEKLKSQSLTISELIEIHKVDNLSQFHCETLFQKMPDQKIQDPFLMLVPGRPIIAQGRAWTRCGQEGLLRLRNLAAATILASFQPIADAASEERFRTSVKQSISIFFSNVSIFLVSTRKDAIWICKQLEDLPWASESWNLTALKIYKITDNHNRQECHNVHAGTDALELCMQVSEAIKVKTGDLTNYHKAIEDDAVRRVMKDIFNDGSFVIQINVLCVKQQ
jgi:hypothetical protein